MAQPTEGLTSLSQGHSFNDVNPSTANDEELLAYVTLLGCEVHEWHDMRHDNGFWWQQEPALIMPGFVPTAREVYLDCLRHKGVINDGNLSRVAIRNNERAITPGTTALADRIDRIKKQTPKK